MAGELQFVIVEGSWRRVRRATVEDLTTTLGNVGELRTGTLAFAIGFHMQPEPIKLDLKGNAWTAPSKNK